MKLNSSCPKQNILITGLVVIISLLFSSCKKDPGEAVSYDSDGKELKECGVRAADGRGPYDLIGKMNKEDCDYNVSLKCKELKYRQIHRIKGHFARGKFGERIVIGTCP